MKIKNIFVGVIFAAAVLLSACSQKQDPDMAAADAELQQRLIGVWCYIDSVECDQDGYMLAFDAYEFTDQVAKYHSVTTEYVSSTVVDKYFIRNGEYVADLGGKEEYAIIRIEEVDGRDHLYWDNDSSSTEFFRMTDEEIALYHIPVGELLSSEAELLGIETTAEQSETEPETSAVSE